MPINRTWWNNLVDDDGSGSVGTVWNKAAIKGLLDSIDAMFPQAGWTPVDGSGAGLAIGIASAAVYMRLGNLVWAGFNVTYPATANASPAKLGGLPFPVANNAAGGALGYTTMGSIPTLLPAQGTSTFGLWTPAGAGVTNATLSTAALAGYVIYVAA
jgi:hypothetical protein